MSSDPSSPENSAGKPKPSDGSAWSEMLRQVHKEQLISQLVGGVAHDFNNIIGVVLGYSDLVLRKLPEDSPLRSKMESIRTVSRKATQLTRQLLTFSRSSGTMPQIFEIQPYLQNLTQVMQRLLSENVEVVFVPGELNAMLEMDMGCLDQILLGLTARLRRRLMDGGKLSLEVECVPSTPPHVAIRLEARPEGFFSESVEPHFERVGMMIPEADTWEIVAIQELVSWVNGYLEVAKGDSDRLFRVCLPIFQAGESGSAEQLKTSVPTGARHILLVEDEEPVRELAQEILQDAGYTVSCASNGEDALQSLSTKTQAIDLVFTDLIMPKMGGIELVSHLRTQLPRLPVLFTSGYVPEGDFQQQLQARKVNFLPKPYEPKDLLSRIAQLLN